MNLVVGLKVDVDTDRGTREGVYPLVSLLEEFGAPACFLFSLGPDNTGKAIRRVFRPGFFQKVSRTSVVKMYGIRTLMNGTLLPAPHIGRRNEGVLRAVSDAGFETGIHCYDHFRWQDYLEKMSLEETRQEFAKAREEYWRIFGSEARTAGAPGWQATVASRQVYDDAGLLYSSDTRGTSPFFPEMEGRTFSTLEIPSTLPTFDELLGRPEFPEASIVPHYVSLLRRDQLNVLTIHAEIEGMSMRPMFRELLNVFRDAGVRFVRLDDTANSLLAQRERVMQQRLVMAQIDGRSGLVATQCTEQQSIAVGRQIPA
jgi:undecaprenyl phosphate-alpha-L-ara4FN deformylase